ncbi:MAG: hypothetical protein Alpg2KO_10310 [Alphaproteobacteria bacterium]
MGAFSIWHWVIVALVVLVLFGGGKIAKVMGETGKGLHAFKKGLKDGETEAEEEAKKLDSKPASDEEAAKG